MQARRPNAAVNPGRGTAVQCSALLGGLFRGGKKGVDTSSYICTDCGYIFDQREPFQEMPNSYTCPVCNAPKRRFRAYKGEVKGRPKNDSRSMALRLQERNW
jgi:rubredoxin